jgi:O-antigen/teichoic acid export membrane protein
LTKQVARGGGIALSGQALARALTLALQLLLSNVLGAHAYGIYSLGTNLLEWLQQISQVGLSSGILRFVAADKAKGRHDWVKGTIVGALALGGLASVACLAAMFLLGDRLLAALFPGAKMGPYFTAMLLALPPLTLVLLGQSVLRALNRIGDMAGIGICRALLNLGLAALAFAAGARLWGAVAALVASAFLALLWAGRTILQDEPALLGGAVFRMGRLLRFSLPVFLAGMSAMVLSRMDLLMIGHFMDAASAGHYRAAVTVASLVAYALVVLNTAFAPMISALHEGGDRVELGQLHRIVTRWVFTAALLAFVAVLFHARPMLALFGPGFSVAGPALILLAAGQLVNASVGSVGFFIQMTGRQDWFLMNSLVSGAANIGLNLWLIPPWGLAGAAVATSASVALNNVLGFLEVWRFHKLQPWGRRYLPVLAAGGVAVGVELLAAAAAAPWPLALAGACVGYGLTIYRWGLGPEDRLVLEAVRGRLMGKGVR